MRVEHKIATAFAVAFLAIALAGAGAYLNARQLVATNRLVVHTYETLGKISELLLSIQGADNGAQAFFLTGEETYLVPYQTALESITPEIDDLRRLTSDNPTQQRNIDLLRSDANRFVAYLHERIAIRRYGGLVAVLPQLGLQGKGILDQIRFEIATIRNAESQLHVLRDKLARQNARQTLNALAVLMLLATVLLAAFYRFIRRDLATRRQADEALRASDRKFRAVLDGAPDAMLITDTAGTIQLANARAGKLFGYPHEELMGTCFEALLQELPGDPASEAGAKVKNVRGKRKDNTLFPIELSESPLDTGTEKLLIRTIRNRPEPPPCAGEALVESPILPAPRTNGPRNPALPQVTE